MWRRLLFVIVVLVGVIILTACGVDDAFKQTTEQPALAESSQYLNWR